MQLGRSYFFFSLLQFCERMIAADVRFESFLLVWKELEKNVKVPFIWLHLCVKRTKFDSLFYFVLFLFSLPLWFVNAFLCHLTWMNYAGHLNHGQNTPRPPILQTDWLSSFVCVSAGCQLLAPWPVGGPCCSAQTLTTVPTNQSTGRCLENTVPLFWLCCLNNKSLPLILYDVIRRPIWYNFALKFILHPWAAPLRRRHTD